MGDDVSFRASGWLTWPEAQVVLIARLGTACASSSHPTSLSIDLVRLCSFGGFSRSLLLILLTTRRGRPPNRPPNCEPPGVSRAMGVPGKAGGMPGDPERPWRSDWRMVLMDESARSCSWGRWLSVICAGDAVRELGLSKYLDRSFASGLAVTLWERGCSDSRERVRISKIAPGARLPRLPSYGRAS